MKEVRDVAYLIEDAIDTFLSEVSPKMQKPTGMMESMKKKLKTTKELPAVHKLAHEITQIKKRMDEIEASRLRYVGLFTAYVDFDLLYFVLYI